MKSPHALTGTILLASSLLMSGAMPAFAGKKQCEFRAHDTAGHTVSAHAYRKKMSDACKMAKERCNRRLERQVRKNKFGRTNGCKQVTEVR